MESRTIKDSQISASSVYNVHHTAHNARLNFQGTSGMPSSWSAGHINGNQWLQVDFEKKVKMNKVATQGRKDSDQWVTSYALSYSTDGNNFVDYKHCGQVKVRCSILLVF